MIRFSIFYAILLVSLSSGLPTWDENPVCSRKGRLMNPNDCGSFYECMEDDYARSLLPFERFCPKGETFKPSTERCGKFLNVQGCNARRGRHFDSNPKYDYICKDSNVSFACADCQTQITCTEGRAYVTRCESNLRCVADSPDFEGGVCHTHYDDQCRCTKPNSYRRDPFSNSTFFLCETENAIPTYYNCQHGMYFDEVTKTCINNDGSPACTTSGLFMFPENCAKYYMCTYALEGWVQTKMSCPDKQLFNQETGKCEDPCNWERKEFKCEIQGRFQNPRDCRRFTECIDDSNGGLLAMERRCPPGFHWNNESKKCVVRIFSNCEEHNEGPLKQCKKDFFAICKPNGLIIPEIIPVEENEEKEPEINVITEEKPTEENPVEEKPVEEKPIEEKPIEEKPIEEKPIEEKPVEEKPIEEKPIEEKPIEKKPVEEKPIEEKPVEVKPVEEKPIEEKPFEEKPIEEKLIEEKPIEKKPVEEKPIEEKPIEEKPVEVKPVEEKPVEEKPVEEQATEEKPVEGKPVEVTPVEETPVEEKPVEEKPVEEKPVEEKPVEEKPVENKPVEEKQIEELQGIQTLPAPLQPQSQNNTGLSQSENEVSKIPVQIRPETRTRGR